MSARDAAPRDPTPEAAAMRAPDSAPRDPTPEAWR
jgi:hypothetical protein